MLDGRVQRRADPSDRRGPGTLGLDETDRRRRLECRPSGQHLVGGRREGVQVARRRRRLAAQLLGGQEAHRPHQQAGRGDGGLVAARVGDAEVGQPGAAGRQEDVAGGDIPMDDAGGMCGRERRRHVADDCDRGLGRHRSVAGFASFRQRLGKRWAVDVIEDQGGFPIADLQIPDANDMRLVERPKRVELALQSAPAGLVGEHHGVEALDGDLVAGLLVDRPPDLGGAAGARGRDEPVAIEQDGLGHARIVPKPASRRSIRRLAVALQFRDGVRCRRAPNRS